MICLKQILPCMQNFVQFHIAEADKNFGKSSKTASHVVRRPPKSNQHQFTSNKIFRKLCSIVFELSRPQHWSYTIDRHFSNVVKSCLCGATRSLPFWLTSLSRLAQVQVILKHVYPSKTRSRKLPRGEKFFLAEESKKTNKKTSSFKYLIMSKKHSLMKISAVILLNGFYGMFSYSKENQERRIMHLAQIINTFQREKDCSVFKLQECLHEEIQH